MLFLLLQGTEEDYQYTTEETPGSLLSLKNRSDKWPAGKVVGGSSSINANLYLRGNKRDYDRWARMGNPGWDYDSIFPYFLKSENVQDPTLNYSPAHGKGGYLTTSRTIFKQPIKNVLVDAHKELGYDYFNDQVNLGCFDTLTTIENGTRCSCSKAFLSKIKRKNLHFVWNALVKKIIIDRRTKIARGVVVSIKGNDKTFYARKEVVLSAGAIRSPQLLMLSGVGPAAHLRSKDIDVISNLPVGENLQDHLCLLATPISLPLHLYNPGDQRDIIYNYFMHRTGPLGSVGILNFHAFINTGRNSAYPNIQFHHIILNNLQEYLFVMNAIGYIDEVMMSNMTTPLLLIVPTLLNPKSFGKILLNSTNAEDKPLIYANFLSDPNSEDLETLLKGVKYLMEMFETQAMKEQKLDMMPFNVPNCINYPYKSDNYWRCIIRNLARTVFHYVGTCKMGPKEDKGVVNSKLQVYGVKNLRVIDASIMPLVTSSNTNIPTTMIAEKGADLIKNDHN